jgi:hypothetical protein
MLITVAEQVEADISGIAFDSAVAAVVMVVVAVVMALLHQY